MTATPAKIGKSGSRGEPEKTRAAILEAALKEFAHEGVAGARTEEIARSAGVNKALLYYYFKDKDGLYAAVLDQVFTGLYSRVNAVLDRPDLTPREKLLQYAATHYDYIAGSPLYPRLVQREFMRTGPNSTSLLESILEEHGQPVYDKLIRLIEQGVRKGEFRQGIDPSQTVTSILGTIAFYFISIPAQRLMTSGDPFAPERIAQRRAAVLDFISAAVFV
jgi:TetR/AcrR family transcriptional regulator